MDCHLRGTVPGGPTHCNTLVMPAPTHPNCVPVTSQITLGKFPL